MREVKPLMFARSLAGHDKGKLYVILEAADEYVLLIDGHLRPIEKPKKKKYRHVQITYSVSGQFEGKQLQELTNSDIVRAIKCKEIDACQKQM